MHRLLLTLLAPALIALPCHAAFIEAVGTPDANEGPQPGDLGTAQDSADNDAIGNNAFGDTGTAAGGTRAFLGINNNGGNDEERRAIAEFFLDSTLSDSSDTRIAIAAAPQVILEFDVSVIDGSRNFTFEAVAITDDTAEDGDIDGPDYQATAGPGLFVVDANGNITTDTTILASTLAVDDVIRFDVTADAKLDAGNIANAFAGYRLQITGPVDLDNPTGPAGGDATRNLSATSQMEFDEARLVVVPEPASLALLAAGGLCLLPRRRR
jgi:hypothetical protein